MRDTNREVPIFAEMTKKRNDIVDNILGGSRTIDTVEEFEEILKTERENPLLLRTFGDFLVSNSMFDEAASA